MKSPAGGSDDAGAVSAGVVGGAVVVESADLDSLRRFKDDVKEVKSGFECGIRIEKFDDIKPGDVIEAFEVVEIARTLEMSS